MGNWRVASIAGTAVEVNISFILVIAWGAWQGWSRSRSWEGVAVGILAVLIVFAGVLLHEVGHVLQAHALNLRTTRLVLMPYGGFAELEAMPSFAWQEMFIALAGPVLNAVLALFVGLPAFVVDPTGPLFGQVWLAQPLTFLDAARFFVFVNIALFVFNMLPAFPMDGGRVLRAAFAIFGTYGRGTVWAVRVSWGFAGLLLLTAFFLPSNLIVLVLLSAMIILLGSTQEQISVQRRRALLEVDVSAVDDLAPTAFQPWDELDKANRHLLGKADHPLPVVVDGRTVGLVTPEDCQTNPQAQTVAHIMRSSFPIIHQSDTLWVAFQQMRSTRLSALPVHHHDRFMGMITLDHIERAWRYRNKKEKK